MKNLLLFLILTVSAFTSAQTADLTRYVNPFIGTAEGVPGNGTKDNAYTNPGAVVPWGLISISPFNVFDAEHPDARRPSPYIHGKEKITGFTHVNLSGVGCNELGVAALMPITGNFNPTSDYGSAYSAEEAGTGYYAVRLDRYNVKAEMTATTRTSISRYTFPAGQSHIVLNAGLALSEQKGAFVRLISDTEIEGFKMLGKMCGGASVSIIYFYAKVSKTPTSSRIWLDGRCYDYRREVAGDDAGAVFSFDTQKDEIIEIVLGVSYISAENARLNVEAEMPVFAFDETRNTAKAAWNKALSRILVEGGTEEEKMKFYTAMYHTLIHPNIYNDANGEYQLPGLSAKGKISNYQRYTLFSLWDTYRTVHPFYALVFPRQASDMVKSMLDIADESGFLPRWIYGAQETGAMVGDPALPVIADTWLRGVRDFDIQRAYKAMKHNALTIGKENHVRAGMDAMLKYGYIPEDENINGVWGSVSTALEFCIADYNLALIAKTLGYENDYLLFYERAMLYRNSFDPNAGFMHPRNADGNWFTPFSTDSYTHEQGFTEGNTWNYTFMVPHDIPGLIKLMGGKRRFVAKLEECFEKGYFDVTNEPDIAYPYLFNYIKGEEWRTQKHVREIVNNNFGIGDDGLPGNDDCGTMSTWLMFSMMGFYPTCPGDMTYQLAAPVFDKITIHLDTDYYTGKTFVIETENARKENCYIKSMLLNGKPHKQFNIRHEDITKGGRLHFSADDRNRK